MTPLVWVAAAVGVLATAAVGAYYALTEPNPEYENWKRLRAGSSRDAAYFFGGGTAQTNDEE